MYTELYNFVSILFAGTDISICLHDNSGIYSNKSLLMPVHARIHSTHFCSISKSTPIGFRLCYSCKNLSCQKCLRERQPYWGYCCFGLLEYVYPIFVNDNLLAILYLGNMTEDLDKTKSHIARRSALADIDSRLFQSELPKIHCIKPEEKSLVEQKAKIFADYIRLLYLHTSSEAEAQRSWFVGRMIDYAITYYYKKITVESVARSLHLNSKYAGRIFKEQVGVSLNQYIADLRLSTACELLVSSNHPISKISDLCGFDSASYFNRTFHKAHGISPSQYRSRHREL